MCENVKKKKFLLKISWNKYYFSDIYFARIKITSGLSVFHAKNIPQNSK